MPRRDCVAGLRGGSGFINELIIGTLGCTVQEDLPLKVTWQNKMRYLRHILTNHAWQGKSMRCLA